MQAGSGGAAERRFDKSRLSAACGHTELRHGEVSRTETGDGTAPELTGPHRANAVTHTGHCRRHSPSIFGNKRMLRVIFTLTVENLV